MVARDRSAFSPVRESSENQGEKRIDQHCKCEEKERWQNRDETVGDNSPRAMAKEKVMPPYNAPFTHTGREIKSDSFCCLGYESAIFFVTGQPE